MERKSNCGSIIYRKALAHTLIDAIHHKKLLTSIPAHIYSIRFSSLERANTPTSLGEDQRIQAKGPSINLEPEIVRTENYVVLNQGKILEERQGIGQIFSSETSGRQQPETLILQHGGQNSTWPEKSQQGHRDWRSYSTISTLVGQEYPRQGTGAESFHKQLNYYYENSAAGLETINESPQVINNSSSNTDFLYKKLLMSENVYGVDQRQVRPRLHEGEIVEVEGGHIIRSVGRKDRHSKVCTAKGPRDRRVRLSALTAIQFYDVQDRLGYDRPSKAVDWLIKNAKSAIDELHQLNPSSSKRYQPQPSNNNNPQDDHQFQFSKDQMATNSRALARDRARERAKERNNITNTPNTDHTTTNFSKFPQQQQHQPGDHNFNNNYDHRPNNILLHQNNNNDDDDDNSNSDQCHGSTKAQSLNQISTHDHHHYGAPAMQQNHDQVMSSIQSYLNLPSALINQAADLRLSLMQRPSVQYLSLLQNPTTPNSLDMLRIRPGPSHHRLMRPVQALSASSGFDPLTLSHHHQNPGFGISATHLRDNNYNNNSSNNIVLQSDHHHYDESGLHRHQYNFFTSGLQISTAALHASAVENHDDQSSGYATSTAFPAVRGTLQSIHSTAAAPACARSIPASISVINNSNNNRAADNNIEQHHDHGCNSIEETAGAFPALIHRFADDHEAHDQDDMKPSTITPSIVN